MKKTIIAQLSIQESKAKIFLKLAETMIKKSNAENGCLNYKLLKELDTKNEFFIFEEYINEAAVEFHNSSSHFKTFFNAVVPILQKEPIIETF